MKSFHEILQPVILMGNIFRYRHTISSDHKIHYAVMILLFIFSLFPIGNVFANDTEKIYFRLYYPVTIYAIILLCAFLLEMVLLMMFHQRAGFQFFMIGKCLKMLNK